MADVKTFAQRFSNTGLVDREEGVIYGVAVITVGEAIGHGMLVDATTLKQVAVCARTYENGLKVKADHGGGVFTTAGFLKNFRIDGVTLRADLFLLESEENREKLLEMAEKIPDTFGLSVSFSGEDEITAGKRLARCVEIYSADIVSEPAANPNGLFSQPDKNKMTPEEIIKAIESARSDMASFAARLQKLEEGFACGAKKEEMAALHEEVKQLNAKITDRNELGAAIAKQFAERLNIAPSAAPAAAPVVTAPAAAPVKNFEAEYKELRTAGKSRAEATRLSIASHPKLYADYRARQSKGEAGNLE